MRQRGESPIPWEGRLSLAVQRQARNAEQARMLAQLAREEDAPLPVARSTPGGDRERLRGIPCAGFGGAMRGTRPTDAIGSLDREGWALAVLSRDIPGTSPGSDPVEALLEAEAATLELLRDRLPTADDPRERGRTRHSYATERQVARDAD